MASWGETPGEEATRGGKDGGICTVQKVFRTFALKKRVNSYIRRVKIFHACIIFLTATRLIKNI